MHMAYLHDWHLLLVLTLTSHNVSSLHLKAGGDAEILWTRRKKALKEEVCVILVLWEEFRFLQPTVPEARFFKYPGPELEAS